jgi:choice-of-anchor B domain-containing protein
MRFLTAALLAALLFIPSLHAQQSSHVRLLCNWNDTTKAPVNGGGQHWNDVWGFTVKGKEYAVIGGTAGAHIIDIDACEERAFISTPLTTSVVHRDFKAYKNYLYCAADEGLASSMLVYDISNLPDSIRLVWVSDRDTLSRVHNIFIDTAKAKLYCGTISGYSTGTHQLGIYSLADPAKPSFITFIDDFDKTHDIYVRNDTAWCSDSWTGYVVLDMSKLPKYRALGGLSTYPFKGYNHSSWVGYDYIGVMADETFGMPIKVIDTRYPDNIQVLSTFSPRGTDTTSVPHNPYLLGQYAFISYYMDGLQIYDLSDPYHPVQAGYYDTYPGADGQKFAGAWGCYPYLPSRRILVSDMQTGLYVFDVNEILRADEIKHQTGIRIFPNPVEHRLSIQLPNTDGGSLDYTIYNMAGATVTQSRSFVPQANHRMDLSLPTDLTPGLYVLRAAIGGQSFTARFTKR